MVESNHQTHYFHDYIIIEQSSQRLQWFNPLRMTMAILASISALSSISIIIILAPYEHQFFGLIVALGFAILGIIGSLMTHLLLATIYLGLMVFMFMVQCRYSGHDELAIVSMTVPMLAWARVNALSNVARALLQLLNCIASGAFVYALWIRDKKSVNQNDQMTDMVLSPI